jgi:hypothetical protein
VIAAASATADEPPASFTIVVMPDTQYYAQSYPDIFRSQTQWIVDQADTLNLAFVTQLGDCVQTANVLSQWLVADAAFSLLEDPVTTMKAHGIPYGIAVGNHDQAPNGDPGTLTQQSQTTSMYNQFFGVPRFIGRPYYGDHFGDNNDNHYDLFSASGLDFIILHLEFDQTDNPLRRETLAWADQVLDTHRDRRAILSAHYLIRTGVIAPFGPQGQAVYDALKHHPNLFLMLCGHISGEGRRVDVFEGNTMHTLLSDYQSRRNGGDGWLRVMQFSPAFDEIRVRTYSTWLNHFEIDADSDFVIDYAMSPGCDERIGGPVLFVDADAVGDNTGTSWENAFVDLQSALWAAAPTCGIGEEIWVAEGVYRPSEPTSRFDARTVAFELRGDVAVYGGFDGTESSRDQRNPSAHVTVFSGDVDANDGPDFTNNDQNAYHVVVDPRPGDGSGPAILDGVTITAGHADGPRRTGNELGGGVYSATGRCILTDCLIRDNAAMHGGGMYVTNTDAAVLNRCRFDGNRAELLGGGLYGDSAGPTISRCAFTGNRGRDGGGACFRSNSEPVIVNSAFSGNRATRVGGAVYNNLSGPTLINCSLAGNACDTADAAGMSGDFRSEAVLTNCIVWGNVNTAGRDESAQIIGDATTVTYSCVEGLNVFAGVGNLDADPRFVRTPDAGADGLVATDDDDFGDLRVDRPASPCIDAGDNTALPADHDDADGDGDTTEPVPYDLAGDPRFRDTPQRPDSGNALDDAPIVDLGAYEAIGARARAGVGRRNRRIR